MDGWIGWMDLRVGGGIEHLTVLINMPQKKTLLYLYLYAWGKNTASKQIHNYFWGERLKILSNKAGFKTNPHKSW